jgi:hypothetical protein
MANRFGKNQKPLFELRSPVRAKGYRSNFTLFESARHLNAEKIRKLRKASLEVGTLEAAGHGATVVAEIRKGMVVGLSLRGCAGCEANRKQRIDKKTLAALREKVGNLRGTGTFKLPGVPSIARSLGTQSGDISIPIWFWPPIVIIFEPGTFCVAIQVGRFPPGGPGTIFCVWCPDTGGTCF